MAEVELTEDALVVHVQGLDRIFALKSRLEIPLSHVLGAEVDPELGHPEWWKSLRLTATQIPWVVTAGTFYQDGERVFWDVHDPKKVVVIRLSDERYARLVIGVDDPSLHGQGHPRSDRRGTTCVIRICHCLWYAA